MAMPILPTCRTEPLNLFYRIPTERFRRNVATGYTADILVDEQPDYSDIPPSIWSVTVKVGQDDGTVSASVFPKKSKGICDLQCPSQMALVYKVMWCINKDTTVGLLGDIQFGPDVCYATNAGDLSGLAEGQYGHSCDKIHYDLRKNALVLVYVTFFVKKPAARTDLKELLTVGTLSDCTLICNGQDFPAHRAILAAQSPVFTAMFQNEMMEKSSGVCKIEGISTDVLQTLLQFAYSRAPFDEAICGKLEEVWSAADKYDMKDLRAECEKVVIDSINADVAFQYLCFAREHKLKKLAIEAAKFIGKNPEQTVWISENTH